MKAINIGLAILFLIACTLPAFVIPRTSFLWLISSMFVAFIVYFQFCFSADRIAWKHGLVLGIITRACLVFSFPSLSDDVYRFFWDGMMTVNGINPYAQTPREIINGQIIGSELHSIFNQLNSADYYSVYPPILQWIFAGGAYVSGGSLSLFVALLKITYLSVEVAILTTIIRLLNRSQMNPKNVLIYALNPLVILEGVGNLHPEPIMVAFVVLSLFAVFRRHLVESTIWFALSISTKLTSVLLWPLYFHFFGKKQWLMYSVVLLSGLGIFWLPLINYSLLANMLESVNLYFQHFEFNASIYYVIRFIGNQILGYNPIAYVGPLLAISSAVIILSLYRRQVICSIPQFCSYGIVILTIYYLFATTVHPWYLLLAVALGTFSPLRYILVWSGLIWLSYAHYSLRSEHSTWWIVVEYLGLAIALVVDRGRLKDLFQYHRVSKPKQLD